MFLLQLFRRLLSVTATGYYRRCRQCRKNAARGFYDNSLNSSFEERSDGVADGPWEVRSQVRKNVKYGADLTKFCATGGVFSKGTKVGQTQYTLEQGAAKGVPEENINKEREVGTKQRQSFTLAVEMGAKVVYATDSGVYPHGDNGKQFARAVRFGRTDEQQTLKRPDKAQ